MLSELIRILTPMTMDEFIGSLAGFDELSQRAVDLLLF